MRAWLPLLLTIADPAAAAVAPPVRGDGPIEIATSAQIAPTLRTIAAAYAKAHAGAEVRIDAIGSDVAMARLSSGRTDIAIIGRVARDPEAKAFEWVYRHPPAVTQVMSGSIAASGHSPALAIRVNAANPLRAITPAQLAAAFRIGGAPPTWGELGVRGPLAAAAIRIVMPDAESGTGRYLRKAALADAVQFDWRRVREIAEPIAPTGHTDTFAASVAAAVRGDKAAFGIGSAAPLAGTRIVPVLVDGRETLPGDRDYPFDRAVVAYADPKPRESVAAFLAFLRGDAAQAIVARGPYRRIRP